MAVLTQSQDNIETELPASSDHEWDEDSAMACQDCGREGRAGSFNTRVFSYHVNLDERGYFSSDVRNWKGKTVFQISSADVLENMLNDGFMKSKYDIAGLLEFLHDTGTIPADGTLQRGD
jgi:hypothetical protein